MLQKDVKIDEVYLTKINGKMQKVRVLGINERALSRGQSSGRVKFCLSPVYDTINGGEYTKIGEEINPRTAAALYKL